MDKHVDKCYRQDVHRTKILTADEEFELCKRIKNGDKTALNLLIEGSLRTVCQIARRYQTKEVDVADLIQEGNLGLVHAAECFDPDSGVRFNTYAIFWIKQKIQRFYHEKVRSIRIPVGKETLYYKMKIISERFCEEYGRSPTVEEIANKMGKSVDFVKELIRDTAPLHSLDYDLRQEGSVDRYSYYRDMRHNPEDRCCADADKSLLAEALAILSDRDREIIKMRYGFYDKEYTLAEISERQGVTIERVRQIQKQAEKQMAIFVKKRI